MTGDLAPLEESLHYYEQQLAAAQEAFDRAKASLDTAQRNLALAKSFYELERRRIEPGWGPSTRFADMTLRDACVAIVIESGRATTKEIVEQLRDGGHELRTDFPGRAIHAALIHARGVRKVGPGIYEPSSNVAN